MNDGSSGGLVVVRPDNPDVTPIDAAVDIVPVKVLTVIVKPENASEVRFGDESRWAPVLPETGNVSRPSPDRETRIYVRNKCCQPQDKVVVAGTTEVAFQLQALPARVVPVCDAQGSVAVTVNDKSATLTKEFPEYFPKNTTQFSRAFVVKFTGDNVDSKPIELRVDAGDRIQVPCVAR